MKSNKKRKKAKPYYRLTKEDKKGIAVSIAINVMILLFALADIALGILDIFVFSKNIYVELTCFASSVILIAVGAVSLENTITGIRNLKIKREYEEKRKNNERM